MVRNHDTGGSTRDVRTRKPPAGHTGVRPPPHACLTPNAASPHKHARPSTRCTSQPTLAHDSRAHARPSSPHTTAHTPDQVARPSHALTHVHPHPYAVRLSSTPSPCIHPPLCAPAFPKHAPTPGHTETHTRCTSTTHARGKEGSRARTKMGDGKTEMEREDQERTKGEDQIKSKGKRNNEEDEEEGRIHTEPGDENENKTPGDDGNGNTEMKGESVGGRERN
ncbi:hypothetical protein B0H11DRAFT_2188847 [Mycena galericulata]|nr:hypothetical protein B0H11DRAFT_2188847 [Mycena galericulata]